VVPTIAVDGRERQALLERIRWGLAEMPSRREAEILAWRLGLDGHPAPTLGSLGERLGVSRERVRQLEHRALATFRPALARSAGGAEVLTILGRLVEPDRDGWEDRVAALAAAAFPMAAEVTARRLLTQLAMAQSKTTASVGGGDAPERGAALLIKRAEPPPAPAAAGRAGRDPSPKPPPSYTVAGKRQAHRQAYTRWTAEEEARLREGVAEGLSVAELSERHGRNAGAIVSRLVRLGLATGGQPAP
jgi:DNA-directed RNA polymerase specialized sigma24 family protein